MIRTAPRAGLAGLAGLAASLLVACAGGKLPPTVGTYCAGCQGTNQIILRPTGDALLTRLQLLFTNCPDRPTTMPLGFQGFVFEADAVAGAPAGADEFTAGELQIDTCGMDRFAGAFWLQRADGSRIDGRIDGALNVDVDPAAGQP